MLISFIMKCLFKGFATNTPRISPITHQQRRVASTNQKQTKQQQRTPFKFIRQWKKIVLFSLALHHELSLCHNFPWFLLKYHFDCITGMLIWHLICWMYVRNANKHSYLTYRNMYVFHRRNFFLVCMADTKTSTIHLRLYGIPLNYSIFFLIFHFPSIYILCA